MEDIRIAAVIFNSAVCQVQRNLERMLPWIQKAARQGADLVCFPELNVTGYTTDAVIRDCAEPIPGPISRRIAQMAADEKIVVLAGLAERDEKGRIFASHLKASPRGDSGVYRKLYISPPEQSLFSAGRTIPLFDANGVKFGVQLCYDAHFPELSARMAVKGADIIFIPHASPRGAPREKLDSWMRHLSARAFDNGILLVACNQVGDKKRGLDFPGVAVVIGPAGKILAKKTTGGEDMLMADLKAADLAAVRDHRMRYFLPNRRPELYQ